MSEQENLSGDYDMHAEILSLRAQLAAARDEGLEDAAKHCDEVGHYMAAAAIRALKGPITPPGPRA